MRQAIVRLLHYPAIAAEVSAPERAGFEASEEPGVALLRELLDELRAQPGTDPGPGRSSAGPTGTAGEALQKLLEREEVITDAAGPRPGSCGRPW